MSTSRYLAFLLANGRRCLVDPEDVPALAQYQWCVRPTRVEGLFYAQTRIDGRWVPMHRFLLSPPKNLEVDHLNGDGLDNRRINLRVCTHQENMQNRRNCLVKLFPHVKIIPQDSAAIQFITQHRDGVRELSEREYEVFMEMARGRACWEIAQKLKIAPSSVSTYRTRILKKLGVTTNAELAQIAILHQEKAA